MNFDSIKNTYTASPSWLKLLLLGIVLLALGYILGRYVSPPTTIVTEKIHEVEKEKIVVQTKTEVQIVHVKDSQVAERVHRVVTEDTKPGGEVTKTTTEDIGTDTVIHDNTNTKEVQYVDRVVEKFVDRIVEKEKRVLSRPDWRIGAGAGVSIPYFLGQGSPGIPGLQGAVINIEADRRILGPLFIGVNGNSQGAVSLNLSAVF